MIPLCSASPQKEECTIDCWHLGSENPVTVKINVCRLLRLTSYEAWGMPLALWTSVLSSLETEMHYVLLVLCVTSPASSPFSVNMQQTPSLANCSQVHFGDTSRWLCRVALALTCHVCDLQVRLIPRNTNLSRAVWLGKLLNLSEPQVSPV